jgi:prepilin-type N-terminal cleavage/methylation domain-containing protein
LGIVGRKQRHPIKARGDAGFTIIELLIVINIVGILTLIAVPSYLSFKDKAAKNSAMANLRNASEVVSSYSQDNGGYVGMTYTALKTYNPALPTINVIGASTATSFCISTQVGLWIAYKRGPAAAITTTACTGP